MTRNRAWFTVYVLNHASGSYERMEMSRSRQRAVSNVEAYEQAGMATRIVRSMTDAPPDTLSPLQALRFSHVGISA